MPHVDKQILELPPGFMENLSVVANHFRAGAKSKPDGLCANVLTLEARFNETIPEVARQVKRLTELLDKYDGRQKDSDDRWHLRLDELEKKIQADTISSIKYDALNDKNTAVISAKLAWIIGLASLLLTNFGTIWALKKADSNSELPPKLVKMLNALNEEDKSAPR